MTNMRCIDDQLLKKGFSFQHNLTQTEDDRKLYIFTVLQKNGFVYLFLVFYEIDCEKSSQR